MAIADAMKKHRAINAPVLLWHEYFFEVRLNIFFFPFLHTDPPIFIMYAWTVHDRHACDPVPAS